MHYAGKAFLGDSIDRPTTVPAAGEQSPVFHSAKVLRGHMALDSAGLGELADGVFILKQHLHHP